MFSDMKPHKGYGASGITWMPPIPEHWRTQRLKTVVSEKNVKGFPGEPLLSATQARGVILKAEFETRTVEAQKSLETLKLVDVNDFVISLRSFQGGIERSHARGIISPAYTVLNARKVETRDYLTLLFKSRQFIDALKLTVTGIREGQNIDYPRLSRELVALPPADEQAAIVKYLAHAHARIDRAIAAKRKLIALLEEQKQCTIQQAVTRGLDPSVPLNDSGQPWLGEIPAHWNMIPARHLFHAVNRRNRTGTEVKLSVTQARGLVPTDQMLESSTQASSFDSFQVCAIGDLVLNKYKAHLGVFWAARLRGLITPNYTVFAPTKQAASEYYELLFHTQQYRAILSSMVYGVTAGMSPLYNKDFYAMHCPVPSVLEQRKIVSFVERVVNEHAQVHLRVLKEIDLIREFRARLTSDVVTGQIDVREIAETLPELTDEVLTGPSDVSPGDEDLAESKLEFAGTNE